MDSYYDIIYLMALHSAEQVEIMGDLTYASSPTNPNSTDLLGIVSEGNLKVDYIAHKDSGNKDLTIHASIMALHKSFEVEHYSWRNARGTLTLVGGLQQKERGPVGTFGGAINSIYQTTVSFSSSKNGERLTYNFFIQTPNELKKEQQPRYIRISSSDRELDALYFNSFAW